MPTTPDYGLPYPLPEAGATAGAVNLRQLAEATAAQFKAHRPAWVIQSGSAPTAAPAAGLVVPFEVDDGSAGAFASNGSTLTWSGPHRLFLATAFVTVVDASNNVTTASTALLRINEAYTAASSIEYFVALAETAQTRTHQLTALVGLNPGDHVDVALTNHDGDVNVTARRIALVSVGGEGV